MATDASAARAVASYDDSWDRPHAPGPAEVTWQESDCYWFYDHEAGVGGYQRLGLKPHAGTAQIMVMAFARDGERFARTDSFTRDVAITEDDRWATGQRAGGHQVDALGDGRMRYQWQEEGCSADLEFYESFYEPRNWPAASLGVMDKISSGGHLEASGRIRGRVTIGDRTYEVDGLAHRDRSWGVREHATIDWGRYRLSSGTTGPSLSWACQVIKTEEHGLNTLGFVVRDGVSEDVTDARILTTLDADGYTPMGSHTVFTLASGEKVQIPATVVQGFITPIPPIFVTISVCDVEIDGHRGFQNLEMVPNATRGEYIPGPEDGSLLAMETGLAPASDHSL
jgi:hypothetical protein